MDKRIAELEGVAGAPFTIVKVVVDLGSIPVGGANSAEVGIPVPAGYALVAVAHWDNSTWEAPISRMSIRDGGRLNVAVVNTYKSAMSVTITAQVLCVRTELCAGL